MYDSMISLAAANGIWAVMFVFLFLYQLKDSRLREVKYQQTIVKLTDELMIVYDIDENIEEIKNENKNREKRNMAKS